MHRKPLSAALALLAVVAVLGGCSGPSEAELLASAKGLLEKRDRAAAVVQLKNVLQKNPESGEARLLLGRALLDGGDGAAALIELERAHNLKYSDDEVLPWLSQAMIATGQSKKMTELYGGLTLGTPKATAQLKAVVAAGYAVLGRLDRSEEALNAALAADSRNVPARLQMARLVAGKGQYDQSMAQVDALITDEPRLHDAWLLKAQLLWFGKRDIPGATKAFEQALAIEPRFQDAHSALATMLFEQRDIPAFKQRVADMRKALPEKPETRYYEAQVAILDGDYRNARNLIQQLLRGSPQNVRVLQLAATLELVGGSTLVAESYLKRVLEVAPQMVAPRRLLAQTHLRSGEPDKALAVLRPLVEGERVRSEDLSLTAEAHLHAGDPGRAEEYFRRAAKLNPDAVNVRTALALTQLSKGNVEGGFAELEALAAGRADSTYADIALISARMHRSEFGAALKAVDRLQGKIPDDALPYLLRGRLLAQGGERAKARESFEQALKRDPSHFAAVTALASLDMAERKPDDARRRYQNILDREPKNQRAMVALAQIMSLTGAKPEEVADLLAKAVAADPDDASPRVAQIDYFLANNDRRSAKAAAEAGAAALPNDPAMLDAVGRVQLAQGDTQQAIASFGKAAAVQPGSARAQIRLAEAFRTIRDFDNATKALNRALELSPQSVAAQRGLVMVALARKRYPEAMVIAQKLQKERPAESIGWQLQSDIHAFQNEWQPAIAAMRESFKRAPSSDAALRMIDLMVNGDRLGDADAFVSSWLKDRPGDARVLFHLAGAQLLRRDFPRAEARFREVLALRPDDAVSMNNLAWLLVQQKKPGAIPLAERALQLAPEEPRAMDTLAMALAADGQVPKALEWQRKAVAKAPEEAVYRLGLARLLIKQGDKGLAREELDNVSKLDKALDGEVAELRKGL